MRLLLFLTILLAAGYEAAIPYFAKVRSVNVETADKQNYFVVDPEIWKSARSDLADLRLYDNQVQVPYALVKASGGSSNEESSARIVNLGKVGDHTEFDLDVRGLNEYGRARLDLDAKNFINKAYVQGRTDLNDRSPTDLGTSTLYDFSNEGLGSNFVLKFAQSSFPYLHVRLAPGISPSQVRSAYVSNYAETRSLWTQAGVCAPAISSSRQSVFTCSLYSGMPVERVAFELPAGAVNFNRPVVLSDEKGNELGHGSISRLRVNRAGQSVVSEDLAIDFSSRPGNQLRVVIENGDDAALPVQQIKPLAIERRLYFDPAGKPALTLYYGDPKLDAPSYDYQKFFHTSADAVAARLTAEAANAQFTGRPDERPWSERHSTLLWTVMLVAVAILGAVAVRGLRKPGPAAS